MYARIIPINSGINLCIEISLVLNIFLYSCKAKIMKKIEIINRISLEIAIAVKIANKIKNPKIYLSNFI